MKARVKATGEIGIVANIDLLFGNKGYRYQSDEVEIIDSYADIDTTKDPDYWTRLVHQYAGMAMQGFISSKRGLNVETDMYDIPYYTQMLAHALVEKMKEERK